MAAHSRAIRAELMVPAVEIDNGLIRVAEPTIFGNRIRKTGHDAGLLFRQNGIYRFALWENAALPTIGR